MAIKNGDLARQSNFYDTYAKAHPVNIPDPLVTYTLVTSNSSNTLNNGMAQVLLAQAAIITAQQIINGIFMLNAIAELVDNAVSNYAMDQRQSIDDVSYMISGFAFSAFPTQASTLLDYYGRSDLDQAIQAAMNTERNQLLQNLSFWQQFDTDFSGGLNVNERFNAEVAFRSAISTAGGAAATAALTTLQNETSNFLTLRSNLETILRPYLL